MDRDFAVERFVNVLETIFQEYGAEVLEELEKEGLLEKEDD